jgi:hypothetical protein
VYAKGMVGTVIATSSEQHPSLAHQLALYGGITFADPQDAWRRVAAELDVQSVRLHLQLPLL